MKKILLIYVGILYSVLAFGQTTFQKLTWFLLIFTRHGVVLVK